MITGRRLFRFAGDPPTVGCRASEAQLVWHFCLLYLKLDFGSWPVRLRRLLVELPRGDLYAFLEVTCGASSVIQSGRRSEPKGSGWPGLPRTGADGSRQEEIHVFYMGP